MCKQKKSVSNAAVEPTTVLSRSIYVSRFNPATETSHIMDQLNQSEILKPLTKEFTITKLVKRRKPKVPVTWVSFKVEVPRQHFDKVTAENVWPRGVTAVEFFTKPPKNPFSAPNNKTATKSAVKKSKPPKNSPLSRLIHREKPNIPQKGHNRTGYRAQTDVRPPQPVTLQQPELTSWFNGFVSAYAGLQQGFSPQIRK